MTIKDILVHVDGSRAMPGRVAAAAGLAQRHDAHLTGLCIIELPVLPSYAEAQIPTEIIRGQRQAFVARAEASEKQFSRITSEYNIRAEWRCVEDRRLDALLLHARYVDLVICGQDDPTDPNCESRGLGAGVALESGRPVLLIPAKGEFNVIGDNIVVAWDTKREAVRAISDAMPILETARRVSVITINAQAADPENRGLPAADIGLHLARHGVETQAKNLFGAPAAVGELLLAAAQDESADLLVMGAYGHAQLRETVFGGVTAHVLAQTDIPVLFSH